MKTLRPLARIIRETSIPGKEVSWVLLEKVARTEGGLGNHG